MNLEGVQHVAKPPEAGAALSIRRVELDSW